MRFKCEILLPSGHCVTHIFHVADLTDLEEQIKKEFPKGKLVSAIGGG